MKIFDYECVSCGHFKETYVKTSDEIVVCPKCDNTMEKRLTMPAFILKGVGVYNSGTFPKAKDGPVLDKELLALDDVSLNRELGLPDNC